MAWNEPGGNGDKDPWGHRNNEQGPPDLDEVVKKLQNKLGSLFGGSGSSGNNGNGSNGDNNVNGFLVTLLLGAGFIVWLLFGFYTVQPAEQGVELRFGRYINTTEQGLNWHLPYPVETVQKVNVQQIRPMQHKALMLTQDENIVEIELVVQYRVKDARDYLFNVADPDNTLHQATESALREVVGTSKMDSVLTSGRDAVAAHSKQLIQEILDRYKTGLIVESVNMQNAQPPEAVQAAFEDVIKAREDEERHKNKAEAYSNEVVQRAGGFSDQLRQQAQGYKSQVVAHAEGETRRFTSILKEYEKAPEVTRQRIYLETMEEVLGRTSKIMLDVPDKGNNLMVLPLDKLFGGRANSTALPNASVSPSTRATAASNATRRANAEEEDDSRFKTPYDPRDRGAR